MRQAVLLVLGIVCLLALSAVAIGCGKAQSKTETVGAAPTAIPASATSTGAETAALAPAASEAAPKAEAKAVYVCPMHPEATSR